MDADARKLVVTGDGSHSVVVGNGGISYHSRHGAIQESKHVFIEAAWKEGLRRFPGTELHLLEMGFGTGLNALLTAIEAQKEQRSVVYTSLETSPLPADVVSGLNYTVQLGAEALFKQIHASPWNTYAALQPFFTLEKKQESLLDFQPVENTVHIIYFDAFGPEDQPELWTEAVFRRLLSAAVPGGMLITYCSKGAVRRAMQAAGWDVSKLPGPPGKREMVRAIKPCI